MTIRAAGAGGLLLLLAACQRGEPAASPPPSAGAALERAARGAGLVSDPAAADPTGVFQADGDLVCLSPRGELRWSVGVSVDYGAGQRCVARGSARGRERLALDFGRDCRIEGRLDGDRLSLPAVVPAACDSFCVGRATLAAVGVDRLSASAAEAAHARGADGGLLCAG